MKFADDETRYEFRKFASDLTTVRDAFAARASGTAKPASRETYVVTRLNIESNVKVRGGRLQVKTLRGRLGMLEQWARPLNAEFPVPVEDVESIVLPALGLDLESGRGGALSENALLAVVSGQHALATTRVDKRRTLYEVGDCVGEFCELRIDDDKLHTIAVEASDADAALALLNELGLSDDQNESYAEFLQRRLF